MKPKARVVLDTNVLISGILFGGNSRQCLELARQEEIKSITSKSILFELSRKLNQKFDWNQSEVTEVIKGIGHFSDVVKTAERITEIKADDSDNRILEAAVAGKADYVISGDKRHILPLKNFQGIKIVSPGDFLKLLN